MVRPGLVQALNWVVLAVAVLAVGGLGLFLGVGTLFFDDPHADYDAFFRFTTAPMLPIVVGTAVCQVGSRIAVRRGAAGLGAVVTVLPVVAMLVAVGYFFS